MATTDNKVLDGAGVAQLSQLVKDAIAQGGGTEYTAGSGIEIDSNNVIYGTSGESGALRGAWLRWLDGVGSDGYMNKISVPSLDEFYRYLNLGFLVAYQNGQQVSGVDLSRCFYHDSSKDDFVIVRFDTTTGKWSAANVLPSFTNWTLPANRYCLKIGSTLVLIPTSGNISVYNVLAYAIPMLSSNYSNHNVGSILEEIATTRPPAALVSTDTAPTVEGAINWVYE